MKQLSKFIKAGAISLVVMMLLSLGSNFLTPDHPTFVPATYAQDTEEGGETSENEQDVQADAQKLPKNDIKAERNAEEIVREVANQATKIHRLFAPLVNFFSFQVGNFLGTDYIYEGPMGKMLQRIWVVSRNIVNIFFVFLLLWMALKEILFVNQESELKKNLLKFTLLLIGVNFSWLGTKIVLDAANVATHVVFAMPSGLSGGEASFEAQKCEVNNQSGEPIKGSCVPFKILNPTDSGGKKPFYAHGKEKCDETHAMYGGQPGAAADAAYTADNKKNPNASEVNQKFWGRTIICVEPMNFLKYSQNTAVIYLTYGMAKIQNLTIANADVSIGQLAVGVLFSLIIQIAYVVALAALYIALIIRMAMLWIFVGFSPFMVLVIWFSGAEDRDFGEFKFGMKEFANWAFVPAKVGAIFAVTFVMISAGQSIGSIDAGVINDNVSKTVENVILEPKSFFMGIGSLQSFIWLTMSVVILWMGVFAVLSKMSIVNKVTDKISSYGSSVAKLVATSPYWAPILPIGKGGEKTSIRSQLQGIDFEKRLREGYTGKAEDPAVVRRFEDRARRFDFNKIVDKLDALTKGNKGVANNLATQLGFSGGLKEMMTTDKTIVMKGIKSMQNFDGREKEAEKFYGHLETIYKGTATNKGDSDKARSQGDKTWQDIQNEPQQTPTGTKPPPQRQGGMSQGGQTQTNPTPSAPPEAPAPSPPPPPATQ